MSRLIIIAIFISPFTFQAQNNGIGLSVTGSREKVKTGFTFERETPNKYRFGITFNYGYSSQNYPIENSQIATGMFELPYMDEQENLFAGYVNSTSIVQSFFTEVNYTQLIGGKLPNSTSGFGIYIKLSYGYVWDKYDALYNSYKYGELIVKDTYTYNAINAAAGFNYRWIKHRNFFQIGIGPNFYYPLTKKNEQSKSYSGHAPFVSTEYELKLFVGRKF